MKIFIGIVALLIAAAVAVFLYLMLSFAEPKNIPLNGLTTRLYIPADVRETPEYQLCGDLTVSRSWQECGGICGVSYQVSYPSTLSEADLKEKIMAYAASLPHYEVSVRANDQSAEQCTAYGIEYYSDSRSKE